MKHLIAALICLISLSTFAQRAAPRKIEGIMYKDPKLKSAVRTIPGLATDRLWGFPLQDTATVNADTLSIPATPDNLQVTFKINVKAHPFYSLDKAEGDGVIILKRVKGVYKLISKKGADGTGLVYSRPNDPTHVNILHKCKWWFVLKNNRPILRVNGIDGEMNWVFTINAIPQ